MASVHFAAGTLMDYYHGGVNRTTFMGFPYADYNDFDSEVYVSHALEVSLPDLIRWFWRVKTWNVVYSQTDPTTVGDQVYGNFAEDEVALILSPGWATADRSFGIGVVIDDSGAYGLQSDLYNGNTSDLVDSVFNLTSASGNTLIFTASDSGNKATATEMDYWSYDP